MFYYKFLLFFTVFNLFTWAEEELNLKCGDAQCSEIIAECSVNGKYSPDSEEKLALYFGEKVEIYGRDDKKKLYFGKVKGRDKKGLLPFGHCRQGKTIKKDGQLVSGRWLKNDQSQPPILNAEAANSAIESANDDVLPKSGSTQMALGFNETDNITNSSGESQNTSNSNTKLQKNEGEPPPNENAKNVVTESKETVSNLENATNTSGNDTDLLKNDVELPPNKNAKKEKEIDRKGDEYVRNKDENESKETVSNQYTTSGNDTEKANLQKNEGGSPQNETENEKKEKERKETENMGNEETSESTTSDEDGVTVEDGSSELDTTSTPDRTGSPSPQVGNDSDEINKKPASPQVGNDSVEMNKKPPSPQVSNDSEEMNKKPASPKVSNDSEEMNTKPPSPQVRNDSEEMNKKPPSPQVRNDSEEMNKKPPFPQVSNDSEEINKKSSKEASSTGKTIENSENLINNTLDPHLHKNVADQNVPSEPAPTHPTFYTSFNLMKNTQVDQKNLDKQASPVYGKQLSSPVESSKLELKPSDTAEQYQNDVTMIALNDTRNASDNLTAQSETNIKEENIIESNSSIEINTFSTENGRSEDKDMLNSENQVVHQNDQTHSLGTESNFDNTDDQNASEIELSTVSPQFSSTESVITQATENSDQSNSYPTSESPFIQNETEVELPAQLPDSTVPEQNENENYSQEIDLNDTTEEPSESWYSSILSYMPAFDSLLTSSPNTYSYEKSAEVYPEIPPQEAISEKQNYGAESHYFDNEESCSADNSWISMKTTSWLVFTSIVILAFSLGYYYMENSKRDLELVIKNNDLASELFILQKERSVLEERLLDAEYNANAKSGEVQKEVVESLQNEISQIKEEKLKLVEREQSLVKKCAMLEANYAKLRQMFAENKQKGERSALIADIKKLKESSSSEIASLKEQLDIKSEEIKTLSVNLHKSNEAKIKLEDKLNSMMADEQIAIQNYQDSVAKLEQMIEESKGTVMKLEDEVGKLKKDCESLKIEKELAETALQKAHGLKSSESLSSWLDSKEIRISLASAEKEIEELKRIKEDFEMKQDSLSSKVVQSQNELQDLNEKYEKAEKDKIEALTKLQVLSDYFNEKETQLQEELGLKEALWLQKQSDDHTIYEQMRTLREENQTFKSQNETLRKEIIDQETSYKKLIASAEEKADGYWVSLRQAERRLKETQIEASQLRNRLTAIETSEHNLTDDKMMKGIENGEMSFGPTTSPPFMMYPGEFIPPPPLIPVTPSRPPPLGRISSPPLGDFTPPLPIPFDLYPPSPPPPPLQHLHRPQPREPTRKQKESQSSNHSSESTSEKPQRRTKR